MEPDDGLAPTLTALENLELSLLRIDVTKRRARARLSLCAVGLAAKMGRYPHELSAEERRRLISARELAPATLPELSRGRSAGPGMKKASARAV